MKNILKLAQFLILVVVISIITTSCKKDPETPVLSKSEIFMNVNDISIYIDGVVAYKFDVSNHQIVYTEDKKSYMVTNMEQTEYYSLTIASAPILNETVTVINNVSGIGSIDSNRYTMKVLKVTDSKYWLWDYEASVGLVIDYL